MRSSRFGAGASRRVICAVACVLLAGAAAANAAGPDQEPPIRQSTAPAAGGPSDFLLGAPSAWLSLRGSQLFPRAGGDLFSFVGDQLTINRSDWNARGFAADLGVALTPRVDLVGGFDINQHTTASEYRNFVASNGQPIAQQSTLKQGALSAGVRFSPVGRGRSISRLAFIPRRVSPYVGGGATFQHYSFAQQGQFVDFNDQSIFTDTFASDGWTVGPFANGGVDVQVWRRLYVTVDGRYSWMHAGLGSDFSGFDGIDLAGFRLGSGISLVF